MKTQKQRCVSILAILTMAVILTCILVSCNGSTSSQNHGNASRFKAEYYVNGELWKTSDKNEDLDYPIIKGKELFLGWYTDEFYFDSYNKAAFNSSKLYSNIKYYGKTVSFSDYLMRLSCLQKDGLDVYSRFNLTADVGDITLKLKTTYDYNSPLNPYPVLTCEWAGSGEIISTIYYIEDSKMVAYYSSLSNSSFVKADYRVVYDPEKNNEDEYFCSDFYLVDSSGDTFALTSSVQKVIKSFAFLSCTALHRFATEAKQNPSETIYTVASFYEHIGRIIYFNDGKAEKDQWYDLSDTVEMYTPSIEDLNKVFEGWYLDSNFKTKFTEIDYDNAGTTVLYAKWTTTDNLLQEWALKYATGKKMMLPENSGKEDAYFTARNGVPYLEYEVYGDNEKAGKTAVSYNIKTNSFVMSLYDKNGIKTGSYSANYQISFTNFQWKSTVTNENITASTTDARKVLEQSKSAALEKIKNAYKFGHALVMGNRDTSSMGNFQLYPLSHKIFYVTDEAWTSFKANNATYYLEGNDLTLAAGSLSNAAFAGWYLDEKHTKKVEKISSSDDRDLILYPLFYTVSVSKNENAGGNVRMPSNITIGTECTITASANSGYTFTGWYIGDEKVSDDTSYTFVMSEENKSFVAHFEPNTYNVLFDANGGECDESSFAVSYNRQYSHALPIPTRQGYDFGGWYYSNALFASSGTYLYAKDITLTAKWTARTDTQYIVNHWQQSLTDEYVVFETQRLQGRTDSNVTPSVKKYVGFSSPATKTARIMPDGTTIIDYYYLRNSYTISFVTNGGNAIGEMTRKFESELVLPMAVRGVDTFGGWFISALLDNNFTDTIMPANDIVLYAWWTEENKAVDFGYTESDEYVTINSYNGTVKNVHIPEFINDKIVSIVGGKAFKNESIVEMVLPSRINSILKEAFYNCSALTKVTFLGNECALLDDYAFAGCSLLSKFNSDKEGSLVVPSSCSAIGSYAFNNLVLITDVTVPDYVTTIGRGAFKGCSDLVNITLPFVGGKVNATDNAAVFGYIFDYTTSSSSSLVYQYSGNYYYYYYIPKTIKSVIVTKQTAIPQNAFRNCDFIERITILQSVTSIGDYAFDKCSSLTSVSISEGVTSIGSYAFAGCSLLSKFNSDKEGALVIPSSCSKIGSYAFNNMVLITDVTVPDSVTAIGIGAFKGCSGLVNITLPFVGREVNATNEYAVVFGYIFDYTTSSSSSLVYQYSGKYYDYYYIPKTIKSVTITKQTAIPQYAFRNCDFIESITIPQNVTEIGIYAFAGCKKLKTLNSKVEGEFNIPQSVTTINQYAFINCLLATKVTLSNNVTAIGDYAFAGCSKISQFNSSNQGELFVPKNCERIGASAFAELKLIEKVCVGDIVYRIGAAAFSKMISLKEITLPFVGSSNVSSKNTYQYPLGYVFGTSSYTGGTATTQYYYGSSISSVTSENYYIPTTLQKVTITLGDLNYGAFYNCSNITEVSVSQDAVVNEKALYACPATITRIDYTATNYSWNGRDIATAYNSGDGSEANPYIISNGDELAFFAQQVNNGESYEGVYFKLSQNIYMANKAFEVIGNDISYFKGVFDGNDFAIKSVYITSAAQNVGLFGKTSGTIKNLRLLSTTINSNSTENQSMAGLLVGHLLEGGAISNCSAQGTITAKCQLTLYCGGLIGYNDGSVDNSSASVNVSATSTSLMVYAGGLIGYNKGDVINSTASGTVSASGYNAEYTHKGNIFGFDSKA